MYVVKLEFQEGWRGISHLEPFCKSAKCLGKEWAGIHFLAHHVHIIVQLFLTLWLSVTLKLHRLHSYIPLGSNSSENLHIFWTNFALQSPIK